MVEILRTRVWNGKEMRPVETIPGMGGGGIKENDGGSEFNWYIVRTFVNVTIYPQHNNTKKTRNEKNNPTKIISTVHFHLYKGQEMQN
jgi:hypothetical protein